MTWKLWGYLAIFLILIIIIIIGRGAWQGQQQYNLIQREGIVTNANVLEKHESCGSRGGCSYRIRYSFQVGGQYFYKTEHLPDHLFGPLTLNGPLQIRYLPTNPHQSHVVGNSPDIPTTIGGIIFLTPLLFGFIAMWDSKAKWRTTRMGKWITQGAMLIFEVEVVLFVIGMLGIPMLIAVGAFTLLFSLIMPVELACPSAALLVGGGAVIVWRRQKTD